MSGLLRILSVALVLCTHGYGETAGQDADTVQQVWGKTATIRCAQELVGRGKVVWFRNIEGQKRPKLLFVGDHIIGSNTRFSVDFKDNHGLLMIEDFQNSDEGVYSCLLRQRGKTRVKTHIRLIGVDEESAEYEYKDYEEYDTKKKDCEFDGKTYKHDETFMDSDDCNSCFCNDGHVGCTKKACVPTSEPDSEPKPEWESKPEVEPKPEVESKPEVEPKSEPEAESEPVPESESSSETSDTSFPSAEDCRKKEVGCFMILQSVGQIIPTNAREIQKYCGVIQNYITCAMGVQAECPEVSRQHVSTLNRMLQTMVMVCEWENSGGSSDGSDELPVGTPKPEKSEEDYNPNELPVGTPEPEKSEEDYNPYDEKRSSEYDPEWAPQINLDDVYSVTVRPGQTAYLPCYVEIDDPSQSTKGPFNVMEYKVNWHDSSDQLLTIDDLTFTKAYRGRLHVNYQYPSDWQLRINDVKYEDAGTYQCKVTLKGQLKIKNVTLLVIDGAKPTFDDVANVNVLEGDIAVLPCNIDNLKDFKVVWSDQYSTVLTYMADRVVDEPRLSVQRFSKEDWSLRIQDVKHLDGGTYICAINTSPPLQKYVRLNVAVRPKIVQSNLDDKGITVIEGEDVKLVCNVTGQPYPRVIWYTPDLDIERELNTTGEVLVIQNVTREFSGFYKCRAETIEYGIAVEKSGTLIVQFAPKVETEDEIIKQKRGWAKTIECSVIANPQSEFKWMKDGEQITYLSNKYSMDQWQDGDSMKYSLQIRDLDHSDYGNYICLAQNDIGWHQKTIMLKEYIAPNIQITGPDHVISGETFRMVCNYTGGSRLPDGFEWFKNKQKIKESDDVLMLTYRQENTKDSMSLISELEIKDMQHQDSGIYTCRSSSDKRIGVLNVTVNDGGRDCEYDGKTYKHKEGFMDSEDCNRCSCRDGVVACTFKLCIPMSEMKDCEFDGKTYKHNETFMHSDDCNSCFCNDGRVGCTKMACVPMLEMKDCEFDGKTYKHNETFMDSDDCNSCFCNDGHVGCTKMACVPMPETSCATKEKQCANKMIASAQPSSPDELPEYCFSMKRYVECINNITDECPRVDTAVAQAMQASIRRMCSFETCSINDVMKCFNSSGLDEHDEPTMADLESNKGGICDKLIDFADCSALATTDCEGDMNGTISVVKERVFSRLKVCSQVCDGDDTLKECFKIRRGFDYSKMNEQDFRELCNHDFNECRTRLSSQCQSREAHVAYVQKCMNKYNNIISNEWPRLNETTSNDVESKCFIDDVMACFHSSGLDKHDEPTVEEMENNKNGICDKLAFFADCSTLATANCKGDLKTQIDATKERIVSQFSACSKGCERDDTFKCMNEDKEKISQEKKEWKEVNEDNYIERSKCEQAFQTCTPSSFGIIELTAENIETNKDGICDDIAYFADCSASATANCTGDTKDQALVRLENIVTQFSNCSISCHTELCESVWQRQNDTTGSPRGITITEAPASSCQTTIDSSPTKIPSAADILLVNRVDYPEVYKVPSMVSRNPVNVTLKFSLTNIMNIRRKTGEVELTAWMHQEWMDPSLSWSAKNGEVTSQTLPAKAVWTPDIVPYSLTRPVEKMSPDVVVVTKEGKVTKVDSQRLTIMCNVKEIKQGSTCKIKIGSWTYDSNSLDIHVDHDKINLDDYFQDSSFKINSSSLARKVSYYSCCIVPYVNIEATFTFTNA